MYGRRVSEDERPQERAIELNARTLRGLAHPLRLEILGLLRADGPATASGLAGRLGESSGTTSWHLRQLAEYGFIEEDPDRGNKRDRWWRARHQYTDFEFGDFLSDPAHRGAMGAFLQEIVDIYHRKATEFVTGAAGWPREWIDAAGMSDRLLWLTADELTALNGELEQVLDRYERPRRAGDTSVVTQWQSFPRKGREAKGEKT